MPWKRKGKCVFKVTKSGKTKKKQGCSDTVAKAKKYLKALYANAEDVSEQEEIVEYIIAEINTVIRNLPMGHKHRNSAYAQKILEEIHKIIKK